MKNSLIKKLESVGGFEKSTFCPDNKEQIKKAFLNIEATFNSLVPQSYKDFYLEAGAFSFLELVCVKCIDKNRFMLAGNKVSVGDFYCIVENDKSSVNKILATFEEQLTVGLLPICDGELGDIICIRLREADYGHIYYFHHESPPDNDLFLIATSFEDFIMNLEIYKGAPSGDELVKNMKVEMTPQFLDLLKKSGFGRKNRL